MKKMSFLLFALLISVSTYAQTWTADKAHSKLGFTVTHLGISEVDGTFGKFDAKITSSKDDFSDAVFELTADMNNISTGNEMRDGHLKKEDMFDVAKFPTMTFKSSSVSKFSDKKYKVSGDLTMKGVTKPVSFELTFIGSTVNQRSGKKIAGFKVSGSVKRTDFGVGTMPSMMVSEDVELRGSGEFIKD